MTDVVCRALALTPRQACRVVRSMTIASLGVDATLQLVRGITKDFPESAAGS